MSRRFGRLALLGIGGAQLGLIGLALGRLLDPGPMTFDVVGILSGLGVVAVAVSIARASHGQLRRAELTAGIAAGLVCAGVWLSLGGATLYTNDAVRGVLLVCADIVFAGALVARTLIQRPSDVLGLGVLACVLVLRALAETLLLPGLVAPPTATPGGHSSGIEGIVIAGLVVGGWLLLAAWEVALGLSPPTDSVVA
jgi:hypothetical protein